MIINTDTSLYGDFDGWLIFIAFVAALIALGIWIAKKAKKKRLQKLGRRTKGKKKQQAKPKADFCYKNCSMIALYQKACQDHEKEKEALREQIELQKRRIEYKERENVELRAELYKYKKQ